MRLFVSLTLFCTFARILSAGTIQFASPTNAASLLELFTSEGCSSCPPAEAWLSKLKQSPALWKEIVPIAFHVDYWDNLGWKDPFGSPDFSRRQRAWAAQGRKRSVYTPGFVLNGEEWRGWFNGGSLPGASGKPVGVLTATSADQTEWKLRFLPALNAEHTALDFNIALLAFNLNSDVKTGENRGRKLDHDFVVLNLAHGVSAKDGYAFQATLALKRNSGSAQRQALAAWVSDAGNLKPIQSVGGWLPREK